MSKYAIIVLAAGESKRLGFPKQLLKLDGEYLLPNLVSKLSSHGDFTVVVTGCYAKQVEGICAHMKDIKLVHNEQWATGQGTSIAAGVEALPADVSHAMICVCDQLMIPLTHYASLIQKSCEKPESIVASKYSNVEGVPVVFPRKYFADLLALRGGRSGASQVLRAFKQQMFSITCEDACFDVDTVKDISDLNQRFNIGLH